jgi:hypothetical protein
MITALAMSTKKGSNIFNPDFAVEILLQGKTPANMHLYLLF